MLLNNQFVSFIDSDWQHVDIDSFKSYFDVHNGVAFSMIDIYDSNYSPINQIK